jgi:hypothetical protein
MNASNPSDSSRVLTLLRSARPCPACEVVVPPGASHLAIPPGQPAATHDRPRKRALPRLNWEMFALWTFVVFSFAALFFAGYVIWAKCQGR